MSTEKFLILTICCVHGYYWLKLKESSDIPPFPWKKENDV